MRYQNDLDNFAAKAKQFCDWAESEFIDSFEELQKAERFLAELHLAILDLPEPVAVWEEVEDLEKIPKSKENAVLEQNKVRSRFEKLPINGYWEIFDASKTDDDIPVFAQVSDDLADIYGDLKNGLAFYEQRNYAEAFWEWKFNFKIHWGNHLVGAQKAIRNYISFTTEI